MKKFRLGIAAVLLLLTQLTYAQGILGLINKSNEFFENLDKGEFETAHNFFDATVKEKILPAELKLFWTRLDVQLGAFQSVEGAQNKTQGDISLVILNCKFEKGTLAFQFAYNKEGNLVGFFVVPNSNVPVYKEPSYADSTKYKETPITVKSPGHELAGMLTVPRGASNFPVVVLVHGSGPSDMDETIGANKTFRDLALGLAAKGIATVRYVKRTTVYPYEFNKPFTVKEEVMDDAVAAIQYAKTVPGVDKKQVYLLGHSLGGILAPRIAELVPDLKGVVLAAAPARKFADLMAEQNRYMYELSKDTTSAGKKQFDAALKEVDKARITKLGNIKPDSVILGIPASYWVDLNQYDQVASAKRMKPRTLVLHGANDFQVSVRDFELWKSALAGKKGTEFKLYPKISHILTEQSEKGTAAQYRMPGNVADYVINDIAAWIKSGN